MSRSRDERLEAETDRLLTEQAEATAELHAIIRTAIAGASKIVFPLGSPCLHFDIEDFGPTLGDWLVPHPDTWMESLAGAVALEREMEAAAEYGEWLRESVR